MKSPNVICFACCKNVYVPNYRIKTFKYCSRKCKDRSNIVKIKNNCSICGTIFEHISSRINKAKYCSRKCYYKSQINKGAKEFFCIRCKKSFFDSPSKNRKYCSKNCAFELKKWAKVPHFSTIRRYMLRNNMIIACEECGYDEIPNILGIHHIDHDRQNNSIENLKILCPMCHSLAHNKHICH